MKTDREAEEAQRLEASKPKRSRAVRSPSRSVTVPKTVRPKTVKPQVAKPQAVAPNKPITANTTLQNTSQKPFHNSFQTSPQKFLPQMQSSTQIAQRKAT